MANKFFRGVNLANFTCCLHLGVADSSSKVEELEDKVTKYWFEVTNVMVDWQRVSKGQLPASALRQEQISTHSVVLRGLGSVGGILLSEHENDWKDKLEKLRDIDWRKSIGTKVNPLWDGVCINAGSVVSNKQARVATFEVIATKLDVKINSKPRGRKKVVKKTSTTTKSKAA